MIRRKRSLAGRPLAPTIPGDRKSMEPGTLTALKDQTFHGSHTPSGPDRKHAGATGETARRTADSKI